MVPICFGPRQAGYRTRRGQAPSRRARIDLSHGAVTDVRHPPQGTVRAAAPVSRGVLFAFTDGSLVNIDRAGDVAARIRLPARVDRLVPGDNDLTHAIGEGHLVTLDIPTTAPAPLR